MFHQLTEIGLLCFCFICVLKTIITIKVFLYFGETFENMLLNLDNFEGKSYHLSCGLQLERFYLTYWSDRNEFVSSFILCLLLRKSCVMDIVNMLGWALETKNNFKLTFSWIICLLRSGESTRLFPSRAVEQWRKVAAN